MHDHNFIVSSVFHCMEQSHFLCMIIFISFLPTTVKGNCTHALFAVAVFFNPQSFLGDICFALSTFQLQLKLKLLLTFADYGIQRSVELEALYDVYMEQSADFEQRENSAASTQDNSEDSTSSLQKV